MGVIKRLFLNFKTSFFLGWKIESNWTDPFLFTIYSLAKPLSSSFILIIMYLIITRGKIGLTFPHLLIGNALHLYTANVLFGMAWAVVDDREFYETLKYIYISPVNLFIYLTGRGFAKFITTSVSVGILIFVSFTFFKLSLNPIAGWFIILPLFFILGVFSLFILGYLFAGLNFLIAKNGWFLTQSATGIFLLLTGAIFPLDVFPPFLRNIGYFIPQTIWMDGMRKILLGTGWNSFTKDMSILSLTKLLLIQNIVYFILVTLFFSTSLFIARRKGLIDQKTLD
ncbi:MAG TPA: ABC transporter permease [Firmicutes bacterium]|nr:ABC transporter permease [Bacillota bacterium]